MVTTITTHTTVYSLCQRRCSSADLSQPCESVYSVIGVLGNLHHPRAHQLAVEHHIFALYRQ